MRIKQPPRKSTGGKLPRPMLCFHLKKKVVHCTTKKVVQCTTFPKNGGIPPKKSAFPSKKTLIRLFIRTPTKL